MQRYEVFAKYAPMIQKVARDDNGIMLKDKKKNSGSRSADQGGQFCYIWKKEVAVHVGFVYSLPEVYRNLNDHSEGS